LIVQKLATATVVAVVTLVMIMLACMVYSHFKTLHRIYFYKRQGVTVLPGADRFYLGNIHNFLQYGKEKIASKGKKILSHIYKHMID